MAYVENLSSDQAVAISWTPLGGSNESVISLGPGAVFSMAFPGGHGGISGLKLAAIASAQSIPSQIVSDLLNLNVANYTTAAPHGYSVGQLVTITGLSNGAALNVTNQPIQSILSPFGFTVGIIHANITGGSDTGDAVVTTVNDPAVAYAILG